MLRSVLAVVFGFVCTALVVTIGTIAATAALVPGGLAAMRSGAPLPVPVSSGYLSVNLTLSEAAAVLGGWVAARLSPAAPIGHVAALAALMLAMSVVSAATGGRAGQPAWYPGVIAAIGVIGVFAGGLLTEWSSVAARIAR